MSEKPDDQAAIAPIREQAIDFYGDTIYAVLVEKDGEQRVYVPIKPISDALGLDWSAQYRRIQRDDELSEVSELIAITAIKSRRGQPQTLALPLEFLAGWLFGVRTSRVDEKLREKIRRYKLECYRVLNEHFQGEALTRRESGSAFAHIRGLALAIAAEAEQRMLLEGRVETVENRLARAASVVGIIDQRLAQTEETVGDLGELVDELAEKVKALPAPSGTEITSEQQATIQGLIQDLVAAANARGIALWQNRGGNNYQAAYATLNRTFRVPSYKNLTQAQFPKAVEWLQREIAKVEEG